MLQNPLAGFLPGDQADLVLIMLVSIPLSYMLSLIYNKYLLLALTMTFTIGFQSLLFPTERWFLWGQQQIVYLILIFAPRKYVGHVVIVESFLALSLVQLRRMFMTYGDNGVDITGIFMMQLFNYIGLGYNYQNGARPEESLTPDQRERRVVEKPNYLTYLGYVNFLPACLVGPVYEYTDFENYLNRRRDFTSIPNTLPAVFREAGVFLLSIALYFGSSYFHIDRAVWAEF
jgi:D-alanyl-lipoteichoic acid acyltransferase DltB (MBOAT superfamily)